MNDNRTKIEFRCTEEEKKRLKKYAEKRGMSVRDYVLNSTIYKRGRSGFNTREKACICRIKTSLNKINSGICVEKETKRLFEECEELCQYSKR